VHYQPKFGEILFISFQDIVLVLGRTPKRTTRRHVIVVHMYRKIY